MQDYLKTVDSDIAALPIVARAFASGDGLATALTKAGVTGSGDAQRVVFRFTSGFSQANDMFDFVLVGKGKDRADHKLMGLSVYLCSVSWRWKLTYVRLTQRHSVIPSRILVAGTSCLLAVTTTGMSDCSKNMRTSPLLFRKSLWSSLCTTAASLQACHLLRRD